MSAPRPAPELPRRRFPGSLRRSARVSGAPRSPPLRRRLAGSLRGLPPPARVSGVQSPRLLRLASSSLGASPRARWSPSSPNPLPSSSIFQLNPLGPPSYRRVSLIFLTARRYSGPLSFRMDWLDLLSVQGTLKSPFQESFPMVFPVVMCGCKSSSIKKAERRRINASELWCWRRLLRVPWTARRSALGVHWKD